MSGGITWHRFLRRLLDFKSPEEIEKGLREEFAEGGLEGMSQDELEDRIAQMHRLSEGGGLNQ